MKNPFQRNKNITTLEWSERLEHVFSKWNVFQCVDVWKGVCSSWGMRCTRKCCSLGQPKLSQKLSLSMFLSRASLTLAALPGSYFPKDGSFSADWNRNLPIWLIPPGFLSPADFSLVLSRLFQTLILQRNKWAQRVHLVTVLCTVSHL